MEAQDLRQPAALREAFAEFEQASLKLGAFYGSLEQRVGDLTRELSSSRAEQLRQLGERERLASRLACLLEALPGGVVVLDAAGRIQEYNPAAADLLGDLASGEPWIHVVVRAFAPKWDDGHDISLKDGRLVNIATEALKGEPGQILLIKDVTETRRLQEQLNHHKRLSATTEMAAALAHQIRTPLAAAMLHAANLVRETIDAEARKRAAGRVVDAMRRLDRLVEEMLLFARGGNQESRPVEVRVLLRRLRQVTTETLAGSVYVVAFEVECDDAVVCANEDSLVSIMLNLVHNARQAAGDRGRMLVDGGGRHGTLELRFTDDGPGIARDQHARVFEPFYTTRKGGTGLGLAVARSVARAHGGDLVIDTGCTAGTRMVLRLPLLERRSLEAFGVAPGTPLPATGMAHRDHRAVGS